MKWMLLLLSLTLFQDGKPKVYTPTELQTLRLQVAQKDALLAKNLLDQAQQNFQKSLKTLQDEGERVKAENGWKDATFDPNSLAFTPKEEPKKP